MNSFAQDYPYMEIGVKGGINLNQISYSQGIDLIPLVGKNIGVVFKHVEEKFLGIQVELNYAEKGSYEYETNQDLEFLYEHKRKLNYIEIPIMSHFNFNIKSITLFINAGPYIAYMNNYSVVENFENYVKSEEHEIGSPYTFDNGLCLGAGMNMPTRIGTFQLEGRFYNGFHDLYNLGNNTFYERAIHQNSSISFSYLISFNRMKSKVD